LHYGDLSHAILETGAISIKVTVLRRDGCPRFSGSSSCDDAEGLLERSQEARTGVVEELRSVLAPYSGCMIEMGFVTASRTRQESFDIAAFAVGTLVMEFPEFEAERDVAATASEGEDPFNRGHVRMVLLFNEECEPALVPATPVASPLASPETA
jgi:hypothetical protein